MKLPKRYSVPFSSGFSRVPPCSPWLSFLLLMLALTTTACSKGSSTPAQTSPAATSAPAAESAPTYPPDPGPLPQIDSKRAFEYIKEIVALGTRPMGSENHKKVENYITAHLKGDQVEDDAFTADTVEGKFPVRNIIAKYPGTKDGVVVILGHYDTNYPLRNIGFVGANDGGSSSAILLEYANHLRGKINQYTKDKAYASCSTVTVEVNPHGTSQYCSRCGAKGERFSYRGGKRITEKWGKLFFCPVCQYEANADFNASANVHHAFYREWHWLPRRVKAPPPSAVEDGT